MSDTEGNCRTCRHGSGRGRSTIKRTGSRSSVRARNQSSYSGTLSVSRTGQATESRNTNSLGLSASFIGTPRGSGLSVSLTLQPADSSVAGSYQRVCPNTRDNYGVSYPNKGLCSDTFTGVESPGFATRLAPHKYTTEVLR
jgi:hypothetical protein